MGWARAWALTSGPGPPASCVERPGAVGPHPRVGQRCREVLVGDLVPAVDQELPVVLGDHRRGPAAGRRAALGQPGPGLAVPRPGVVPDRAGLGIRSVAAVEHHRAAARVPGQRGGRPAHRVRCRRTGARPRRPTPRSRRRRPPRPRRRARPRRRGPGRVPPRRSCGPSAPVRGRRPRSRRRPSQRHSSIGPVSRDPLGRAGHQQHAVRARGRQQHVRGADQGPCGCRRSPRRRSRRDRWSSVPGDSSLPEQPTTSAHPASSVSSRTLTWAPCRLHDTDRSRSGHESDGWKTPSTLPLGSRKWKRRPPG